MEQGNEGDGIVLFQYRQIDCDIPDTISSIGQITPDQLIDIVTKSLNLIIQDDDNKYDNKLPPNVAARHRISTNIATKIKELGYPGDCGYNQLLYPVEIQTRTLLTWLVQKLPRSEEEIAEESLGANAILNRRIMTALNAWKKQPWRLSFCADGTPLRNIYHTEPLKTTSPDTSKKVTTVNVLNSCSIQKIASEPSIFERHTLECIYDVLYASKLEDDFADNDEISGSRKNKRKDGSGASEMIQNVVRNAISAAKQSYNFNGGKPLGPFDKKAEQFNKTLQELITDASSEGSTKSFARGTRFSHATEFSEELSASIGKGNNVDLKINSNETEDAETRKARLLEEERLREEELEQLREEVRLSQNAVETQERQYNNAASKIRQLESELAALLNEGDILEREIMLKRKTLEMLPSAAENIGKLQVICGASAKRLIQLAQEWETHRRPLVEQLRNKKMSKAARRATCRAMVEEMKKCREEMVRMVQDIKEKQERAQVLSEEMSKLPKNINRNIYTHRILDIISSIAKQNKEIDKIVSDIRDIQKTINNNSRYYHYHYDHYNYHNNYYSAVSRADAVAEELIFSAANAQSSDPATVDTYRRLRTLRTKFESLLQAVSKQGNSPYLHYT